MPGLFQRTVDLLQDFMDGERRDTWLKQAFFSEHRDICNAIDQSGPPRDFTTRCIKDLDRAECIVGRHTVSLLIEEIKQGVGSDSLSQFKKLWLLDIDWVEIPAGPFLYQNGEKQTLPIFYISRYT